MGNHGNDYNGKSYLLMNRASGRPGVRGKGYAYARTKALGPREGPGVRARRERQHLKRVESELHFRLPEVRAGISWALFSEVQPRNSHLRARTAWRSAGGWIPRPSLTARSDEVVDKSRHLVRTQFLGVQSEPLGAAGAAG